MRQCRNSGPRCHTHIDYTTDDGFNSPTPERRNALELIIFPTAASAPTYLAVVLPHIYLRNFFFVLKPSNSLLRLTQTTCQ